MTMAPRFDISGDIGKGTARADLLAQFLNDNPGPVEILLNSPGGLASEGAAMMAALERHGKATVRIEGVALSAASLAAMGARKVLMHDAALMMIHEPRAETFGTADALRADAAALDKMNHTYAKGYARATGQPLARIEAWMAAETWLEADEAVELGFADEVYGGSAAAAIAAFDYQRFRNTPAKLNALALSMGWGTQPKTEKHNA
jgi:ATP-dependent Clp protease, protease subunit